MKQKSCTYDAPPPRKKSQHINMRHFVIFPVILTAIMKPLLFGRFTLTNFYVRNRDKHMEIASEKNSRPDIKSNAKESCT